MVVAKAVAELLEGWEGREASEGTAVELAVEKEGGGGCLESRPHKRSRLQFGHSGTFVFGRLQHVEHVR